MIFICYAHEDADSAERLYNRLTTEGKDVWLDRHSLLAGQDWATEIRAAIHACDYFIALLSSNSISKKGFVQKELRYGLEVLESIPPHKIFLIPARLEPCTPQHDVIQRLHWVDLFPVWDDGYGNLRRVFSFIPNEVTLPSLADTKWTVYESDGGVLECYFAKDGVVKATEFNITQANGKWRQAGSAFYMEFNNSYAQYRGTLSGSELSGDAQNIEGKGWTWSGKPVR